MKEIIKQLERERDDHYHKAAQINNALEHLKKIEEENSPFKNKMVPVALIADDITRKKEKKVDKEKKKYNRKSANKWSPEVFKFVKGNLHLKNREIVVQIKKKFGMETTEGNLGVQMAHHGIKRKYIKKKPKILNKFREEKGMSKKEIKESLKNMGADDPEDDDDLSEEFSADEESDE